jgi:Cu/Zn superoxide dismutase
MTKKLLFLLLLFTSFSGSILADHLSSSLLFIAKMNGDAEVPAVTTEGQGLGLFTFDEKKSTLYVNVALSNLSGPITGIHIHEAEAGVNGPVVYNLTSFLQGNRLKGSISNFTRASFAKLVNGEYYINAHTEMNPGGEIRGQIQLEADLRYTARLSGAEEVPAVTTDARGVFVARVNPTGETMDFHMVFEGLSGPVTGAHIHMAPAGVNGGVVFDLMPFLFGNIITGTLDISTSFADLLAGNLYVNVHTVDNPGGEIRGQLMVDQGLSFDAVLDGDQEFPAVETSGRGVGIITVSPDLSSVNYHIIVDSLSGPITGAHFHAGVAGSNGGVVIDLTDDINGNIISGSAPLTLDLLNTMLSGGLYINVHTDENPGGEIRGQVYKYAREPYTFDLSGGQEVPPVTTPATGVGFVSIDRDQTNAHYMALYTGLLGEFNASHFHNAPPGVNGGVLFDVTSTFNDGGFAEGTWDATFDAATSLLFRENEMYFNVHSDMFPGGEIRGNIVRIRDLFTEPPFDPQFGNDLIFTAELNGDNEVPAVVTDGIGLATIYFDEDRTSAHVNVTVHNLSGPITGAHIHAGFDGENGPVIFPLTAVGNRIQTEITGITPAQMETLMAGGYYINIHTAANPGGEIRGQIFLDQDLTLVAGMSGSQEVPEVTTDARGLGIFHYTLGQLTLDVNVQVTELSSPITGAHLHAGAPGENGGVIIDLGGLRTGNTIQGTVDITIDNLIALITGNVYVNVHTEDNPGGEIRGQLGYQPGLVFDGWMSGLQEVPFANTVATGLAIAVVSNDLATIDVAVVTDGLSGPAGAAHFHNNRLGVNGGVVLDLSTGLDDDDIIFSGDITSEILDALLTGGIYVNVHTPAYPGGEIRGQLFRLARDGYGFDMCPEQEVGAVNAPDATGSAYVSIDRLHSNMNVVFVTNGLTDDVTASHFHEAPLGVNGGVVFDLSPFVDNGAISGYGVPIDTSLVNMIRSGNAYINVHTSLHPAGEVRGQVVKEFLCSIEVSVDELENVVSDIILSPVPVSDMLNVAFGAHANTSLTLAVYDLSGKILSTGHFNVTEGQNMLQVETAALQPGFYMLMITDGKGAEAYKFVK